MGAVRVRYVKYMRTGDKLFKLYQYYIIKPHWVNKLKKYIKPRYEWTDDLKSHYEWSPIHSLWFSLKWSHINFFTFISRTYWIPTFSFFLVITTLLNFLYLLFLITFVLYWLIKFFIFFYKPNIKEIKPNKWKLKRNYSLLTLLNLYCLYRPYLRSYSLVYKIFKNLNSFNTKTINYKILSLQTTLLTIFLFIGYIVGLPLRIIYNAYKWSDRWVSWPFSIYEDKWYKVVHWSEKISYLLFSDIKQIESYRVFKDKNSNKVYFNPFQKPKISIDGTTIPNIINNYWKFLKEVIEPVSFRRSTGKDSYRQCFGKYHSGGHIELSNSYIITNFLTHYPQNNLGIISQYNSNNTKCFDLSDRKSVV